MMKDIKKASVKSKVEAILFSAGQKIKIDEICRLSRARREEVVPALHELAKDFDEKQSSLMLVEEGDSWKLTVRDLYIPIVRRIVTETELPKGVIETLAVIAFKYPILQSDLIKIRTNKAYDHLAELEADGYVSRQKHGRTNLIKLTEKFFKYFDLTEENLKEQFKDFDSISKAIKEKEEEVERIKEEQRKRAEELKQEDDKIRKEIESLDEADEEFDIPLEVYKSRQGESHKDAIEHENLPVIKESQSTAIVEVEQVQEPEKQEHKETQEIKDLNQYVQAEKLEEPKEKSEQQEEIVEQPKPEPKQKKQRRRSKGIHLSPDMEAIAEKKAEAIMHGEDFKGDNKKHDNER